MTEVRAENLINGVPDIAGQTDYKRVPYMLPNEFKSIIIQALFSPEELITHFEWNGEKFAYEIECNSRPIEITAPPEVLHIIRAKKDIARSAAVYASNKFPHNIIDDSKEFSVPKRWCKFELLIRWDSSINCLAYKFNYVRGGGIKYVTDMSWALKLYLLDIHVRQYSLKLALIESGIDINNTNLREYLTCDFI